MRSLALADVARPPDSRIAFEAEELLQAAAPGFLVNHSLRCFYYSTALGDRNRISFDPELMYVASIFHDAGLIPVYDTGRCFEEDGARTAAAYAQEHGWSSERRTALAEAIRLHAALAIELDDGPEAFLLWHATALDVRGHRHGDLPPSVLARVVAAYPRLDFKSGFASLLEDQAARKPTCAAAEWVAAGISRQIAVAPFD